MLEYLEKNGNKVANDTLYKYLEALCGTFIINKVYRYDINGKAVLKSLNKFYATDLGVKRIKTNSKEIKYIQACYDLRNEETLSREFNAFNNINDNYPKYVISTNKEDYSRNGIKHVNIFDFLMEDEF